ncbi:MAG: hypothetical protein WBO47_04515 [Gammaproteobacteria bacterium]
MARIPQYMLAIPLVLASTTWGGVGQLAMAATPQLIASAEDYDGDGSKRYRMLASRSSALVAKADMPALAAHLDSLKTDPALDDASKEKLLRGTLLAMTDLVPDASTADQVRALKSYQSKARIPWNEHGHATSLLASDVAAAARFVEMRWQEIAARKSGLDAISAADSTVIDRYAGGSESERRGIEEAFAAARPELLVNFGNELGSRLDQGEPVAKLASITAIGTRDPGLLESVLRHAPPEQAVQAIVELDVQEWGPQASPALEVGLGRSETASASLLKLAPLSEFDQDARRILVDALSGPHGSSAAAAIARSNQTAMLDQLALLLGSSADEQTQRNALLALRLADNDRARDHLRSFARQADAPPALVAEVPAWLRD